MAEQQTAENFVPMYAALQELGLTENEQRLYIASLSQGPGSISVLAKQLGLPRPNLYKIIDGLAEKGLVDKTSRLHYMKQFTVEPPSKIAGLLKIKREKQAEIDRSFIEKLPSYLSSFQQGEGPLKVKVLVGRKDFRKVYDQMYEEEGKEVWFFGSLTDLANTIGRDFLVEHSMLRVSKGVRGKALALPTDIDLFSPEENKTHDRETRYLTDFSIFNSSFHIFSNKIIFYQTKTPMAVLIEDEYIVAMMKSLFTGLWEKAGSK